MNILICFCYNYRSRRGGRAVEGDGLENRCRGDSTVSSNLTPSAIHFLSQKVISHVTNNALLEFPVYSVCPGVP